MNQVTHYFAVSLLIGGLAAAAPPSFRAVSFDVSELPRVRAVLDMRTDEPEPPAISASEFRLREDGKPTSVARETRKFRDTELGLSLIVALDASPSMKGRPLSAIRQGLAELVNRKRKQDRIAVLSFADDMKWEAKWDASEQNVQDAFRKLQVRGDGTRLYDAVAEAMEEFEAEGRRDPDFPARRCLLILSDGHDLGSKATLEQTVQRLRSSRIRVDTVGLARSPAWLQILRYLANAGFGGYRVAQTPEQLTEMLERGIDVLLDTPTLEFDAEQLTADGKTHELGLEHLPTRTRDQMSVKLQTASLVANPRVWAATGGVAVLAGIGLLLAKRKKAAPVAVPVSAPPPPRAASPAPSYQPVRPAPRPRPETVAEPVEGSQPAPAPFRYWTEQNEPPPAPTKAPRAPTALAPAPQQPGRAAGLVATTGPYAGQRFEITADEYWIGSATNNHLHLAADPGVSGNHACVRREQDFYRLYDNGSLNNTFVNGQAVGQQVTLLRSGDQIHIGSSDFTFHC